MILFGSRFLKLDLPIYLDNHSTTRVDPRVVAAMLPYWTEIYGNAGSTTHAFGWEARDAVQSARERIAAAIGARPSEIVFTGGATESDNLAIFGIAELPQRRGDHIISVRTEHKAVLDPLRVLSERGLDVTLLDVEPAGSVRAGVLDPQRVAEAIRPRTCLVSVMAANNEIGVVQDMAEIARICRAAGVPLHCDATQAIGRIPFDVAAFDLDLVSFTAHKLYGPKGVGALYIRRHDGVVRLTPRQYGGGQEHGFRSGTLDVPAIVGFATALGLAIEELPFEIPRQRELRDRLYTGLAERIPGTRLNGPALDDPSLRLANNLNVTFERVHGESLIMAMRDVAVSSGSACTSANPEPSHVLNALGLDEDSVRASLRFGLGRFTTAEEIEFAIESTARAVAELRALG